MLDEDVSSDTLRDRWEAIAFPEWRRANPNVAGLMDDAIEYAAQLEDQVEELRGLAYVPETHPHREPYQKTWREEALDSEEDFEQMMDERDEARAERDRLHDALTEAGNVLELSNGNVACNLCGAHDDPEHGEDCPLREVERGDTIQFALHEERDAIVDELRDLGYEEAAGVVNGIDSTIRALAEADDQEGE